MTMSSKLTTSSSTSLTKIPVADFLKQLQLLKGIPYIWDGKDEKGLDCSGCQTYALLMSGGPDIRMTHNCARIITECSPVSPIGYKPGLLAFYGYSMAAPDHVMCVVPAENGGTLVAYGSCGGNHYTTTPEIAQKIGAMVKERPSIAYRHDFLGVFQWDRINYSGG